MYVNNDGFINLIWLYSITDEITFSKTMFWMNCENKSIVRVFYPALLQDSPHAMEYPASRDKRINLVLFWPFLLPMGIYIEIQTVYLWYS